MKEGIQVLQALIGLDEVARARGCVVEQEILGRLLVQDLVGPGRQRLALSYSALLEFEPLFGFFLLSPARTLAAWPPVLVPFCPPKGAPSLQPALPARRR